MVEFTFFICIVFNLSLFYICFSLFSFTFYAIKIFSQFVYVCVCGDFHFCLLSQKELYFICIFYLRVVFSWLTLFLS